MEIYRWEVYTRETGLDKGDIEPICSSSGGLSDPAVELGWAIQSGPTLRQRWQVIAPLHWSVTRHGLPLGEMRLLSPAEGYSCKGPMAVCHEPTVPGLGVLKWGVWIKMGTLLIPLLSTLLHKLSNMGSKF